MEDDEKTMKDVSHTAPTDTSVDAVWGRGRVPESADD